MNASLSRRTLADDRRYSVDFGWLVAMLASVAVVTTAATTPWLSEGPRALIAYAFKTLCHERPDRSFMIGGVPVAVCHRCFGLYVGIAAGLLGRKIVFRFRNGLHKHALLIVAGLALLLFLDWGLDVAGLWANTPTSRFGTGLLLGLAGGAYLSMALSNERRLRASSDS